MDLIKIGAYIAGKRKELGMTQKELAEKLGMSDKSVSKWERGVCLPDVSVYGDLCSELGISLNEFLAGEDIEEDAIAVKSEDNLRSVIRDSIQRVRKLKSVIVILIIIAVILVGVLGTFAVRELRTPNNYVEAVETDSAEMKTAQMLSGVDGAYLFRYRMKDEYKSLTVYLSEYRDGKRVSKSGLISMALDEGDNETEGMIAIVSDFNDTKAKVVIADQWSNMSRDFTIFEEQNELEKMGRTTSAIEEQTEVELGVEQGLLVMSYGEDEVESRLVEDFSSETGNPNNECDYYISFKFE